jgi:tryptophan-rich hypothetical protein
MMATPSTPEFIAHHGERLSGRFSVQGNQASLLDFLFFLRHLNEACLTAHSGSILFVVAFQALINRNEPMNRIHFRKLLHSKWTARNPSSREKHFEVIGLLPTNNRAPDLVIIEAIYTGRLYTMPWHALRDASRWIVGWK